MFAAKRLVFPEKWYSLVLSTARPSIVEDLETKLEFAARLESQNVSLKSAFGVPILVGKEIIGVCQYFSTEPMNRDQIFLDTMSHLAGRLGHIIETG
jgi:GAF domain-containing protein